MDEKDNRNIEKINKKTEKIDKYNRWLTIWWETKWELRRKGLKWSR